ncbi:hypothetical protein B0H13DRAFT_2343972 [Mycena leptocephala]|nr:hypothetical protein B0H13DRAFT_2343972 [Mycena leptocephala]
MPPQSVCITECREGGLGHALAQEFHSRGLRVFAAARTLESMATLAGSGIETFEVDITSSESITNLKDRLTTLVGGRIDILVTNVGVACPLAISDFDKERVKDLFNLNVWANGSDSSIQSAPYIASIAALHSFGDTLRAELAPLGVTVLTASPSSHFLRPNYVLIMACSFVPAQPRQTFCGGQLCQGLLHFMPSGRTTNLSLWIAQETPYVDSLARAIVDDALGIKQEPPRAHCWTAWIIHVILGRLGFDSFLATKFGLEGVRRRQVENPST